MRWTCWPRSAKRPKRRHSCSTSTARFRRSRRVPELARVPAETRLELARLARSYLLVACISGRPGEEAAALVGLDGIRYVGNHGLELDERASELAAQIAAFRDSVALPVEDKGLSLSYHYRGAEDEDRGARRARAGRRARPRGGARPSLGPESARRQALRRGRQGNRRPGPSRLCAGPPPASTPGTTRPTWTRSRAWPRPASTTPFESRSSRTKDPGARGRSRPDGGQPRGARAAPGDALGVWRRKAPGNTRFVRFRKGARLDPGQVRDVRGRRVGGAGGLAVGGGGIGVVVLVIYLLVSALSGGGGGLPGQLGPLDNQRVGEDSAPSQVSQECKTGEDANQREDCRIVAVVNSVQKFWDEVFTRSNQQYQPADTVFFTDQVGTGCGTRAPRSAPSTARPTSSSTSTSASSTSSVEVRRRGHAVRGGLRARARVRAPRPGSPRRTRPGPGRLAGT